MKSRVKSAPLFAEFDQEAKLRRTFWHRDRARIYMGDCLEWLARLPSGVFDAVITDPPYCSGGFTESKRGSATSQGVTRRKAENGGAWWFRSDNMTTAGLVWLLRAVSVEAARVLKPTGSMLLFTDWRMVPMLVPALESSGLRYRGLVVWDKGAAGLGHGFRGRHELVIHLGAPKAKFHSTAGANVIQVGRVHASTRVHPTQKPVELMGRLIDVVCPPDGLVLDPFMGSASTGVAALSRGRGFVGLEREQEFCRAGRARLLGALAGAQEG